MVCMSVGLSTVQFTTSKDQNVQWRSLHVSELKGQGRENAEIVFGSNFAENGRM